MVFKLVETAQRSWRRLDGHSQLPKLILGVKFTDGLVSPLNPKIYEHHAARMPFVRPIGARARRQPTFLVDKGETAQSLLLGVVANCDKSDTGWLIWFASAVF